MKKYIGTKQVEAEPMNELAAIEKGLARKNSDHHEWREGYHVKYNDGYQSWSPKEVFEEAYHVADTALERMLIEGEELTVRLEKLKGFIASDKFKELDVATKALLISQAKIMYNYQLVLNLRYSSMEVGKGTMDCFPFGIAIILLSEGFAIRRAGWNGKGLFVIKQVPSHIESDIIPNMQSLPQSAKDLILKGNGFINYTSQCLIYNENTGRADSWVPSISDIFAEDWELVDPDNHRIEDSSSNECCGLKHPLKRDINN